MGAALDKTGLDQRKKVLQIIERNGRGHIGSAFSIMEIIHVLYDRILRFDARNPTWSDRDRFVLSKGHGCLALYIQLAEKHFFPESELWKVSEDGAILGGHPEYGLVPGVEASTGSLGHGLSIGVGIALSAKMDKKDFKTYVLIGDGECNEGAIWEAALSASKHQLSNLTVLLDYNKFQCYGPTKTVLDLEPLAEKWRSFGFCVEEVDGHDPDAIFDILKRIPFGENKPNLVICHTTKGKGVAEIENNPDWHHKSRLPADEAKRLYHLLEG